MTNTLTIDMTVEIVQSVFSTMMDLEVLPINALWLPAGDALTSCVLLEGDWNGAVFLHLAPRQACELAGRFLSCPIPDEVDEDVRDVAGELANMIGGNIKSVIATNIQLSMPSIVDSLKYNLHITDVTTQNNLAFRCGPEVFWVIVFSKARPNN